MKTIKKISTLFLLMIGIASCGSSDVIVNIYGYAQYNCTTHEYRLTKATPLLSFLDTNTWYTREEFHKAFYEASLEPLKDLPMSEETLAEILPSQEMSTSMFNEFIAGVDCTNPKDILF
ncbi:MAG: hypothetical protein CMD90_02485 [Gammaproteobacteria bacterium]|nr:hypothetical protein [Gammaproteobacteria bacterium]|tara:strand:+ start:69 stop:425 length:357 start_codon:yes stop_codon:yes gene_type:complete